MTKYVVQLMMMVFVFCNARAMEMIKQDPSSNGVCYLNRLSVDLLNYIASFLMESEEEFSARTRVKKELPLECNNVFNDANMKCTNHWSFCPDESKLVVVVYDNHRRIREGCWAKYYAMIVYFYKDRKPYYGFLKEIGNYFDAYQYDRIALSPRDTMLATFYKEKDCYEGEDFCEYVFKIQKVNQEKEREICFPYDFYPDIIAFNKQGTHLIAHGKDPITKEDKCHTFSLKMIDANQPHIVVETKNELQEYLRDKFVCNKYIEGKK